MALKFTMWYLQDFLVKFVPNFFLFQSGFSYSLFYYLSQVCYKYMRTWGLCDVFLIFMFYVCKFCKYIV